ncbi:SLBB domain-containing protein [bacterium]|nr:SLBB domain-containing protein [FCB group bacterium]MBL7190127.1 SLBB domain-containing protein [bacterium]
MTASETAEKVKAAGVVGAGGAGFPTHVKLQTAVDIVIANGAECEPLLGSDRAVMVKYPDKILQGLQLLAESTGARRKIIAVKKKYSEAIKVFQSCNSGCEFALLPDYYPAGDEVEIIKFALGEIVPERGLPLDVGAVVDNVETLMNIASAVEGIPVTRRYVTVCGEVKNPSVISVPIGASVKDTLDRCGGITIDDPVVYLGGPMMGTISGTDAPVTKTTTGIFILPDDHFLIQTRSITYKHIIRQAQAACTSCRLCTDACPRYLLGHDIEPHKIMRTISLKMNERTDEMMSAYLCCFCGVCEYACPMRLSPRRVYEKTLEYLMSESVEFNKKNSPPSEHPMRQYRRIPGARLMTRMGLDKYNKKLRFDDSEWTPQEVKIPLKQHIGFPAEPVVSISSKVLKGELLGEIPAGKLSARIHSSIDGTVTEVNTEYVKVRA